MIEQKVIKPTVGRVVHYYPGIMDPAVMRAGPLAALVTAVQNDRSISVMVFPKNCNPVPMDHIWLIQPGETVMLSPSVGYCKWMPYQVTKSYGSESGEPAAGVDANVPEAEPQGGPIGGGPSLSFESDEPRVTEIDVTEEQLFAVLDLLTNLSHQDRMDAGLEFDDSILCEQFYQTVERRLT